MRKLLLFIVTFILISNSTAISQTYTPHWTSIDWNGIPLTNSLGFEQEITILKKPSGTFSNTQVSWSLYVGNGEGRLNPFVQITNHNLIVFGFLDVTSDVAFTQEGSTKCTFGSPNAFLATGTFQARCETPFDLKVGETYKFQIYPVKVSNTPAWKSELISVNSGKSLNLGIIRFSVPQSILLNSQSMFGFNQIWNSGENGETLRNAICPGLHDADVIFGKVKVINSPQMANLQGTRQSPSCSNISLEQSSSDITVKYNLGGNPKPTPASTPVKDSVSPSPSPEKSTTASQILSDNTINISTNKLSFSGLNVSNNKIDISVSGDQRDFDTLILISPELSSAGSDKIAGIFDGKQFVWSLALNNKLSGKLIPIKVVGLKNGVESQPIQTEIQVPLFSNDILSGAPLKLVSLRYNYTNSNLLIFGQIDSDERRKPSTSYLYSPNLGISQNKPISGEIVGNKVIFSINVEKKYLGKRVNAYVYLKNQLGTSPTAKIEISLPKSVIPTTKEIISCKKGATIRTFQSKECPPGWTV